MGLKSNLIRIEFLLPFNSRSRFVRAAQSDVFAAECPHDFHSIAFSCIRPPPRTQAEISGLYVGATAQESKSKTRESRTIRVLVFFSWRSLFLHMADGIQGDMMTSECAARN